MRINTKKKKRISEDVNTTTWLQKHNNILCYCDLTNISIENLFHHCYFSHHAKSMPLFVYYGFQDKSYHRGWSCKKFSLPFEHFAYVNIDTLQGTRHKQYN